MMYHLSFFIVYILYRKSIIISIYNITNVSPVSLYTLYIAFMSLMRYNMYTINRKVVHIMTEYEVRTRGKNGAYYAFDEQGKRYSVEYDALTDCMIILAAVHPSIKLVNFIEK